MQSLDTNVVVRLILCDDPRQFPLAEKTWLDTLKHGGIFLSMTVLLETHWVLSRSAGFDRTRIVSELQRLSQLDGVRLENAEIVARAIERYADSQSDFADCVILECSRSQGALPVRTFDKRFSRLDGVSLIEDPMPAPQKVQ
ncbi:type II toxin-antitoxin system VapC family toxin [Magnetovirga frankeli]|uniref:PIN domain-containing protein n=1 Tax=Magnetovirga frankeli TaxID=947516 RepID=UPI001293B427|nr:type II toxin-antitoxin system VapC family toxin [gamma proteobacterium SS-5]